LTELQHGHLEQVVTTTHVHLDERRCLEVILLRGSTGRVRELADKLIGTKGVETGRLVLTAASPVSGCHDLPAGPGHSDDDHEHDAHARGEKHERPPGKSPARRRTGAL